MRVTYTPPLIEQIRSYRREVVIFRAPHGFVQRVDPETREACGEPQQFLKGTDGSLTILPKDEWVKRPRVVDITGVKT
jgi:hypothetical protein